MTKENVIKIDGKDHDLNKMSEDQKYWITQIRSLTSQENEMNFKLDPIRIAKNAFTNSLIKSLEEKEDKK